MVKKKNLMIKRGVCSGIDSVCIVGSFDMIDSQVDDIADAIFSEGKTDIVFDFKETTYLTSSGLAVLIKALRKVQSVKGTLYIANITQDMYGLISCSSLGRFLKYM